jgi:hypothetical protein
VDSGLAWRYSGRRRREAHHESPRPRAHVARETRPARGDTWLLGLVAAAMVAGLLVGAMAFYTVVAGGA